MPNQPLDPQILGVDLALSSGDLAANGRDLNTTSSTQNVLEAFARELTTPFGYLGRFVYDYEGLKIIDGNYGNPAYYQLSEPMTQDWIDNMEDNIKIVADAQPRLSLLAVDYTMLPTGITFALSVQVLDSPKPTNIVLLTNGSTLSVQLPEAT